MERPEHMQDWKRLASYAVSQRAKLGYTSQGAFAEKVGVSKRTINGFERGESKLQPVNLARLEQALEWSPGSAAAVLAGGDPTLQTARPSSLSDGPMKSTLLDQIMKLRRTYGDNAARAYIEDIFARPAQSEDGHEVLDRSATETG